MPKYRDGRARPGRSVPGRTVRIAGHKTHVTIEDAFWSALKEIAATKSIPVYDLLSMLKKDRHGATLASAIRLLVLEYYRG